MIAREPAALGLLAAVFLGSLIPSLVIARTTVRDDLRQQDIAHLKHALEMFYNKHEFYPAPPAEQPDCTSSHEAHSWLFGPASPLVKNKVIDSLPHDLREAEGHTYRYCATEIHHQKAAGFFLEAVLERKKADHYGFDEDEKRKYHFRILNNQGRTLYRVCGGNELQCQK